MVLRLALGHVFAAILLIFNYYGKLSLSRMMEGHKTGRLLPADREAAGLLRYNLKLFIPTPQISQGLKAGFLCWETFAIDLKSAIE